MTNIENRTSPPAGLTAGEPFVPARGRAAVVVALFAAYVAAALFSAVLNLLPLADDLTAPAVEGDPAVMLYDLLLLPSVLAAYLVCAAAAVAFLVWLYRVSRNLPALGVPKEEVEFSPGWAVAGFFLPFYNLVGPYKAVHEVWDKSDPAARVGGDVMSARPTTSPLVLGSWLAWLASNALGATSWGLSGDIASADDLRLVVGLHVVADLAGVVAAVLAILVVRGIGRRQRERALHLARVSYTPPPPPVFT